MGTAGSVCAQPPAAQGLLDQFLASVRLFRGPGFWQVSDKVNPGSVNPEMVNFRTGTANLYQKEQQSTQKHSQKHLPVS